MKPPRIRGRFRPRQVAGRTAWVSEDGAWVVLTREHLDAALGRPALDETQDLGLVMGTGAEGVKDVVVELDTVSVESIPAQPSSASALPPVERTGVAAAMAWATSRNTPAAPIPPPAPEPDDHLHRKTPLPSPEDLDPPTDPTALVTAAPEAAPPHPTEITHDSLRAQLAPVPKAPPTPTRKERERQTRRIWYAALAMLVVSFVALGAAIVFAFLHRPDAEQAAPAASEEAPAFVAPPAQPAPTPGAAREVATPPPSDPSEPPAQGPSLDGGDPATSHLPVAPEPPTVPASASQPAWQTHIDKGWALIDSDPEAAADNFRRALVLYPRHGDAHHGLGTVLLREGQPEAAAPYLCEARRLDRTLAPAIDQLLQANGLACAGR